MPHLRITIAQSSAIVFCFGFAFAALRNANIFWSSATYTLAIIMITAAVVGALVGKGKTRSIWTGFAVFGWSHLLISSLPPWPQDTQSFVPIMKPFLVTVWGIVYLQPYLHPQPLLGGAEMFQYEQIAHSLGIMIFGMLGSIFSRLIMIKGEQPNP